MRLAGFSCKIARQEDATAELSRLFTNLVPSFAASPRPHYHERMNLGMPEMIFLFVLAFDHLWP